jgi:hypothetical protein
LAVCSQAVPELRVARKGILSGKDRLDPDSDGCLPVGIRQGADANFFVVGIAEHPEGQEPEDPIRNLHEGDLGQRYKPFSVIHEFS